MPSSVAGGAQLKITEANLSAYRSTGATVGDTGGAYNPAGDFVSFTLNNSAATISNVIIFDSTPAFTTFLTATAGTLPTALTGSLIAKPTVAGKGPIRWTFSGSLDPGQSGTVNFSVVIE